MTLNLDEITAPGFFTRYPRNSLPLDDAHLRLAALIGVAPVQWKQFQGTYVAVYDSSRPDVDKVVTTSSVARWGGTAVHREGHIPLVWGEPEDILRTARFWIGLEGEPEWSLVRDIDE